MMAPICLQIQKKSALQKFTDKYEINVSTIYGYYYHYSPLKKTQNIIRYIRQIYSISFLLANV